MSAKNMSVNIVCVLYEDIFFTTAVAKDLTN